MGIVTPPCSNCVIRHYTFCMGLFTIDLTSFPKSLSSAALGGHIGLTRPTKDCLPLSEFSGMEGENLDKLHLCVYGRTCGTHLTLSHIRPTAHKSTCTVHHNTTKVITKVTPEKNTSISRYKPDQCSCVAQKQLHHTCFGHGLAGLPQLSISNCFTNEHFGIRATRSYRIDALLVIRQQHQSTECMKEFNLHFIQHIHRNKFKQPQS